MPETRPLHWGTALCMVPTRYPARYLRSFHCLDRQWEPIPSACQSHGYPTPTNQNKLQPGLLALAHDSSTREQHWQKQQQLVMGTSADGQHGVNVLT